MGGRGCTERLKGPFRCLWLVTTGHTSANPKEQYRPFGHCLFSGMYGGHINTHTRLVCRQPPCTHKPYTPDKVNLFARTRVRAHTQHPSVLMSDFVGCLG